MEKVLSINRGNKLIAYFMGATYKSWKDGKTNRYRFENPIGKTYAFLAEDLKYHESWDWLMPVVEKIESIKGERCVISELGCDIYSFGKHISQGYEKTKIESVWLAVVEFIQWHNNQSSNNN